MHRSNHRSLRARENKTERVSNRETDSLALTRGEEMKKRRHAHTEHDAEYHPNEWLIVSVFHTHQHFVFFSAALFPDTCAPPAGRQSETLRDEFEKGVPEFSNPEFPNFPRQQAGSEANPAKRNIVRPAETGREDETKHDAWNMDGSCRCIITKLIAISIIVIIVEHHQAAWASVC